MEKISHLIDRAALLIESTPPSPPAPGSANSERRYNVQGESLTLVELLWRRMTEIYGHRWASAYGERPTDGWITAVGDLSADMIRSGLVKMARCGDHNAWPPTALEFRTLCLPCGEDFGFPSLDEALQQAVGNRTGKHAAVIHTLRRIDGYALRRMPLADALKNFAPAWQKTINEISAGGELPQAPLELSDDAAPKPKRARTPDEIARCRRMLADTMTALETA